VLCWHFLTFRNVLCFYVWSNFETFWFCFGRLWQLSNYLYACSSLFVCVNCGLFLNFSAFFLNISDVCWRVVWLLHGYLNCLFLLCCLYPFKLIWLRLTRFSCVCVVSRVSGTFLLFVLFWVVYVFPDFVCNCLKHFCVVFIVITSDLMLCICFKVFGVFLIGSSVLWAFDDFSIVCFACRFNFFVFFNGLVVSRFSIVFWSCWCFWVVCMSLMSFFMLSECFYLSLSRPTNQICKPTPTRLDCIGADSWTKFRLASGRIRTGSDEIRSHLFFKT